MSVDFFIQNVTSSLLEAEVNPNSAGKFERDYFDITGVMPSIDSHYQRQPNKWGAECRVYFNCDADLNDEFLNLNIDVEQGARPYRGEWFFRINNNDFFWALVRAGYRLGKN